MSSRESSDFKKLLEALNKVCHQFQFEIYEYSQIGKTENFNIPNFWGNFMEEYPYWGLLGDHLFERKYGDIIITTNFNKITFHACGNKNSTFTKVTIKNII